MPWFWGRGKDDDSSSSYEECTDSEEEEDVEGEEGVEEVGHDQNVEGTDEEKNDDQEADGVGIPVNPNDGAGVSNRAPSRRGEQEPQPRETSNDQSSRSSGDEDELALAADPSKLKESNKIDKGRNGAGGMSGTARANGGGRNTNRKEVDEDSSTGALHEKDEHLVKGVIPEAVDVHGSGDGEEEQSAGSAPRLRADSALSYGTGVDLDDDDRAMLRQLDSSSDDEDDENGGDNNRRGKVDDDAEEENEAELTSKAEKRSLLALAAEHDRVDILQAILSEDSGSGSEAGAAADREELLHGGIPPLHIAVSYGSVNATNFLLRNGADPSIRPNVAALLEAQKKQSDASPLDVPNMRRFDDVSAWELAFGDGSSDPQQGKSGWTLFGNGSSSNVDLDKSEGSASRRRRRTIQALTSIAPSKREGIRHAFTAEALRCIGSDEVDRLKQLVNAGMPTNIDIGGKDLLEWCVELGAQKCQELLQPPSASERGGSGYGQPAHPSPLEKRGSIVIDRGEPESVTQLSNRLDELESLSQALSVSLDGLAEEVSVCNGLLLMGGGASALASHVRSLKATKEGRFAELERMEAAWENAEDELAYWIREGRPDAARIAAEVVTRPVDKLRRQSSLATATTPEEQEAQQRQLKAQVAASEHKIRKLRASIADLSEVCSRDLAEVEKRGLSGGITLVRGLREELREIDFQLSEAKNGDATCRTKIRLIQSHINDSRKLAQEGAVNGQEQTKPLGTIDKAAPNQPPGVIAHEAEQPAAAPEILSPSTDSPVPAADVNGALRESDRVLTGQATAIAIRHGGGQGFFPLSLWQILLRIIGFGDEPPTRSDSAHSQVLLL
jgi:Ankyrin repeat